MTDALKKTEIIGHIDPEIRLEMLVGHFSDQFVLINQLIEGLRLRSNASHCTRSDMEMLRHYAGVLALERLGEILEEARSIRAALGKAPPEPHEMEPRVIQIEREEASE